MVKATHSSAGATCVGICQNETRTMITQVMIRVLRLCSGLLSLGSGISGRCSRPETKKEPAKEKSRMTTVEISCRFGVICVKSACN